MSIVARIPPRFHRETVNGDARSCIGDLARTYQVAPQRILVRPSCIPTIASASSLSWYWIGVVRFQLLMEHACATAQFLHPRLLSDKLTFTAMLCPYKSSPLQRRADCLFHDLKHSTHRCHAGRRFWKYHARDITKEQHGCSLGFAYVF